MIGLASMLLGIEVATGAVSLGLGRLWGGLRASVRGDPFLVSTSRYMTGATILLTGVVLLAGVVGADLFRRRSLTEGPTCPACGSMETKRVPRRIRHRILSTILDREVTRRRCNRCGWSGLAA